MFAQGDSDSLDKLVDWLWSGPGPARVTGVESETVALDITLRDFFIHPNPSKTR
jgi:acylphosphatase